MLRNLVFVIKASQEFIRHSKDDKVLIEPELNSLFESITDVYIPLLRLLEKWENSQKATKIGLVLPPALCAFLDNPEIQNMYLLWLDARINFGQAELERNKDNKDILDNVEFIQKKFKKAKQDFEKKYNKQLLPCFLDYHKSGFLELLGTTATDIFFPHFQDLPEVLSAQIEMGVQSYRHYFGEFPEGFWLPELGYYNGVEKLIKSFGYAYTILDSRSILLSQTPPKKGIFYPTRSENLLAYFSTDSSLKNQIFSEDGFVSYDEFLNIKRDIGFELGSESVATLYPNDSLRVPSGYKYYASDNESEEDVIYNRKIANQKVKELATQFLKEKKELLDKVEKELPESKFLNLLYPLDAQDLCQNWAEWFNFLECVTDKADEYSLNVTSCNNMLTNHYGFEKITPYYSSVSGAGYGENLLSNKNSFMLRHSRKACERMIDLADRFTNDTGLKTRLLNLAAKELLLALSSGLCKMIDNDDCAQMAKKRFTDSINAFTTVFDSLGSNVVSTEWLTTLELYDDIFPWINYIIFSKKK